MLRQPKPATRRYTGKIADPSQWGAFVPRAGDIVVSTPPKSGTTWTQAILALLLSGDPKVDAAVSTTAPWIDITTPEQDDIIAALNAQTGRRQLKTHTPLDGIPIWPDLRYISVFRHPLDVHFSFRRHVENMRQEVLRDIYPDDIHEGFRIFLQGDHRDGASLSSIVDNYRSALAMRGEDNFLCLHYADMSRDLASAFDKIAGHIGVFHSDEVRQALIEAATFQNMKDNADRFAMAARDGFWRNDSDFFDSGTSRKWIGVLSEQELAAYRARMDQLLAPEECAWLEQGGPMP